MDSGERTDPDNVQSEGRPLKERIRDLECRVAKLEETASSERGLRAGGTFASPEEAAMQLLKLAQQAARDLLPASAADKNDRVLLAADAGGPNDATAQITTLDAIVEEESDEGMAALASAAAHPTRIRLLKELVVGERAAGDLGAKVGLEGGPLYHHLHDLLATQLVEQPERSRYALTGTGRKLLGVLGMVHRSMKDDNRKANAWGMGDKLSSASGRETEPKPGEGEEEQ